MKNRDELAEAFAVADAFVAERDRRAAATGAALCGNTHRVRSGEDVLCDMPLDHDGDWHGAESDAESYGKPGRFRWHSGGPNGSESWTAAAPLASEDPRATVATPEAKKPHSPDDGCSACDGKGGFSAHGKPSGTIVRACEECGGTPAPKALWFGQDGRLLLGEDNPARWYEDGAEASAFQQVAHISIAATTRAHAERIVAAALAAGRAVEP